MRINKKKNYEICYVGMISHYLYPSHATLLWNNGF